MTRATSERHTPNDSWDGYRLVHRIAQSQATEVWEVSHLRTRRTYAMKVVMPHWLGSRHVIQSLRWEFNVGRTLNHPAIIKTYDYGVSDGLAYLVMEFYPAPSLKTWARQTDFNTEEISRVVGSMAQSMTYFHRQGWVHRDIKPDNFLVGEGEAVKLIDFNLAKKNPSWLNRWMRFGSKVQGTPSYMSPEQIRGDTHDFRSDLYSFGCVLFELLTGKLPYTGESANELLNKHLRAPVPSPRKFNAKINPVYASEIQKLLAKQPGDRPKSMERMLENLSSEKIFTAEEKTI